MHELSVCLAMLGQVTAIARRHGAGGVSNIIVRIGPLSGIEPALLAHAFPVARAGTVAEGAVLTIEPAPLKVHCETCGAQTETNPDRLVCGACGERHTRLISGDELLLVSVELMS